MTQSLTIDVTDIDPTITITPGTAGNEAGPINGNFNITLDQASSTPITVAYNLGGTATKGDDYTIVAGTGISNITATSFTIDAGVTNTTLNINVIDDTVAETDETIELTLTAGDTYGLTNPVTTLSIVTNDPNQAPTALALNDLVLSLAENVDTTQPIKVAKILVVDDGVGTNQLSLSGTDAASFEILGNFLYLKAGVALSYEAKAKYDIAINVDDTTVGSTPDATELFTLAVLDIAPLPVPLPVAPVLPVNPDQIADTTRIMKRDRVTQEVSVRITNPDGTNRTQVITYGATFAAQSGQNVKLDDKWSIVDTNDLNNDGIEDILFQNSTDDEIGIWYMGAGGTITTLDYLRDTSGSILKTGRTDWKAIGLANLGTGQERSLVWRNPVSDEIAFWTLGNGSTVLSYNYLRDTAGNIFKTGQSGWEIKGLGNFDGTGSTDLVLYLPNQNQTAIYQLQGQTLVQSQLVQSYAGTGQWQIQGTGDLNRDGLSDIIWGNSATPEKIAQTMTINQGTIVASQFVPIASTNRDYVDFVDDLDVQTPLGAVA